MPWVKLDDHFDEHPKVAAISPLGVALQVAALCYCNRNLTNGFVPRSVAKTLLDFDGLAFIGPISDVGTGSGEDVKAIHVIGLLLAAGVWHEVRGGYMVHNFGLYQPSREEVLALREVRSAAGRKGGQAKPKQTIKQTPSKPQATGQAKQQAKRKPVPVPVTPVVKVTGTGTVGGGAPRPAPAPSSAIASGDADSGAQVPKLSAQLRAEAAARTLADHGLPNGQPPPPATRDDVDPADFEAERRRQLAALKASESETP